MTQKRELDASIPLWVAYSLAVLAGIGMSTQAHINGLLGSAIGDGLFAAGLSFAGGLIVLMAIALFSPRVRAGLTATRAAITQREIPLSFVFAGAAGAAFVFSQGAVSPVLGLALFSVAFVCGLTIGGLVMDVLAIGPAGRRAITPLRLLGAGLGVAAVFIAVSGTWNLDGPIWIVLVPAVFGVGVSWQQAANGRLTQANHNPWSTTLINFGIGFVVLSIGIVAVSSISGLPSEFPTNPWLYVGGPVGISFIAIASVVVRYIGVLVYGLCATTGQLVSAIAFDVFEPGGPGVTAPILAGVIAVAAGATLASLSDRWSRRSRRS